MYNNKYLNYKNKYLKLQIGGSYERKSSQIESHLNSIAEYPDIKIRVINSDGAAIRDEKLSIANFMVDLKGIFDKLITEENPSFYIMIHGCIIYERDDKDQVKFYGYPLKLEDLNEKKQLRLDFYYLIPNKLTFLNNMFVYFNKLLDTYIFPLEILSDDEKRCIIAFGFNYVNFYEYTKLSHKPIFKYTVEKYNSDIVKKFKIDRFKYFIDYIDKIRYLKGKLILSKKYPHIEIQSFLTNLSDIHDISKIDIFKSKKYFVPEEIDVKLLPDQIDTLFKAMDHLQFSHPLILLFFQTRTYEDNDMFNNICKNLYKLLPVDITDYEFMKDFILNKMNKTFCPVLPFSSEIRNDPDIKPFITS
jgi:hypothetical protein